MQIFLAAPLFSESECGFNEKLAKELREAGFNVWMAQEAPFIEEGTDEEKRSIYEEDIAALKKSDVVVAVLDGTVVESGVAFEIGYAAALKKSIIGLKTDYRSFSNMENINLILEVPMKGIYDSTKEVIEAIKEVQPKEATASL
ncbi:MAG: nucleoside 2-deoxyribosyltransferase [Candidatus Bathyarchaeota archaeon]|nr:nucleoside 2-deoxyribosyltransferase [Candidatus Bathyarchaeota archaeon]